MPIYMRYASIDGASTTKGLEKWVELLSLQWGVGRNIESASRGGKTREASEPQCSEIVVTKRLDKSTTKFFEESVAGDLSADVKVKFTVTGKDGADTYLAYELSNCGVSGYSLNTAGDTPTETLSLNFTKITCTYTERDSAGKPGSPDTAGWDLEQVAKV